MAYNREGFVVFDIQISIIGHKQNKEEIHPHIFFHLTYWVYFLLLGRNAQSISNYFLEVI